MKLHKLALLLAKYTVERIASAVRFRWLRICKILQK